MPRCIWLMAQNGSAGLPSRALLATRDASAHSDSNGSLPGGNRLVDRRRNLRQNKITRRDLLFVSPRDQARRANRWHPRYDPSTIFSDRRDAKCKQPASAFLLSLRSCASCEAYNAGPIQGMSLQQDFACHDLQGRRGRREKLASPRRPKPVAESYPVRPQAQTAAA